jgi:hypothetical protein
LGLEGGLMAKNFHDGKGKMKEHTDDPVKSGESVYSEKLWSKIAELQGLSDSDNNKSEDTKKLLKEKKLMEKLSIHTDERKKEKEAAKVPKDTKKGKK